MRYILMFILIVSSFCASAQKVQRIQKADLDTLMTGEGKVINLWASWCGPCVKEIPHFKKQAAVSRDVRFVFISLDIEEKDARRFAKRYRIDTYWLDEPNANDYKDKIDARWEGSIPVTIFLMRDGERKFVEGEISAAELKREVSGM